MSVGPPVPLISSAAGAPLASTKGPEVERAHHATAVAERHVQGQEKAETAAAIGEPDGDEHQTGERDADGRRPWVIRSRRPEPTQPEDQGSPPPKDPAGQSGSLLDLAG
ncbi:MAG: hypothetical protein ABR915_00485 [Thermoguttaceae bacterium]|jgi:hypothetical protein